MSDTTPCQSCRAPMRWVRTAAGVRMPLDPEPTDDGNVEIIGGRAVVHAQTPLEHGPSTRRTSPRGPQGAEWSRR